MNHLHISTDLRLPLELTTQAIGILGKRRAGKSTTARRLTEQLLGAGQQVVVVDPKGDWWGLRSSRDGTAPGLPILILGGEHGDVPLEANAGELIGHVVVEEGVSCVLDLGSFRKGQVASFMAEFLETIYRLKAQERFRTACMLVIDEADAIAPQKPMPDQNRMLGAAEDIVRRGGQRGLGCTMATQRASVLNKNVLTQIEVLIALRTIAPQDLDAITDWINVHGTPEQRKELLTSLPSLPIGTAWFWSPGWPDDQGIFQRVAVDLPNTYDSSATPKPGERKAQPKNLADVDLGSLRERMAATIAQAKANDPKELNKQIADLKRQLGQRPTDKETTTVIERVEVPVVPPAVIERFETLTSQLIDQAGLITTAVQELVHEMQQWRHHSTPRTEPHAMRRLPPDRPVEHRPDPLPPRSNGSTPSEGLTVPQQRILDALAAFEALGLRHVQRSNVAIWADQSPKSSGYTNNLGALRSRGLIDYPSGGTVALTNAGRQHAQSSAPITSLDELHRAWYARLPNPQANILRVLIATYPHDLERTDLALAAHQSPTSSGFTNNLGALRSLGLIDYPSPKHVIATDLVFPAGVPA